MSHSNAFRSPIEVVQAGEPLPDPMTVVTVNKDGTQARCKIETFSNIGLVDFPDTVPLPSGQRIPSEGVLVHQPELRGGSLQLPPSETIGAYALISTVSPAERSHGLDSLLFFYGRMDARDFEHAKFIDPENDRATYVLARPGVYRGHAMNTILLAVDNTAIVSEEQIDISEAIGLSAGVLRERPNLVPEIVVDDVVLFMQNTAGQPERPRIPNPDAL